MVTRVLIANRGEIALRILRACRELGLGTVAVYSTEDRDTAVVELADRAVHIGPGPARDSYLNIPAIIEAARLSGADAVHPGYGFLSENSDFAEVCADEGLTFVGPPANVMQRLADKATARSMMVDAGLPLLPGSLVALEHADEARAFADRIGYPVIIKAAAGGGGRGMSIVRDPETFLQAYTLTRASAQAIFGDGRVYVERYLDSARHVEIQILCDQYGNAVHLGARDCSVQRRHQKLIEESPAPGLSAELLRTMGQVAIDGALSAGYVGAGTFEFLLDPDGRFYFMEVNCRLQVEHPVTEAVTGIDLVAEQFRIAAGEKLSFTQDDLTVRGAAIECRINAENPDADFAPTPGVLTECRLPGGPFVRVDTHVFQGYRIPALYDSLLAKVIVWAPDREQAIARMRCALGELRMNGPGVSTSTPFLLRVLESSRFRGAAHDTSLVEELVSGARNGAP